MILLTFKITREKVQEDRIDQFMVNNDDIIKLQFFSIYSRKVLSAIFKFYFIIILFFMFISFFFTLVNDSFNKILEQLYLITMK